MPKIGDVLANPQAFGFEFRTETVAKAGVELEGAQILCVIDLPTFEHYFPGKVLQWCDGQSCRVWSQGINRTALWADRSTSAEDLQQAQVASLLGSRSGGPRRVVVERQVFVGLDGVEYPTLEEAKAASVAHLNG